MTRLLLALLGLVGAVLLLTPQEQKNQLHGFVINGGGGSSKSQTVDGIHVEAVDVEGHAVDQAVTGTDGQFRMVVPPAVKLFRLVATDPKHRFWAYKPEEDINNNIHPRDFGQIALYPVSQQLSQLELQTQVEVADLLWKSNPLAATDLRGRLDNHYLVDLASENCKGAATSVQLAANNADDSELQAVSWTGQGIQIPNLLRNRIAADQASAVGSLRTINTAQITFASTYDTFAPLHMLEQGRADLIDIPESGKDGYCTFIPVKPKPIEEPRALEGKFFLFNRQQLILQPLLAAEQRLRPSSEESLGFSDYLATAIPERPGVTGLQYYYTDRSGIIRYSDQAIRKPNEGKVIP